jgi:hypothetical protein
MATPRPRGTHAVALPPENYLSDLVRPGRKCLALGLEVGGVVVVRLHTPDDGVMYASLHDVGQR